MENRNFVRELSDFYDAIMNDEVRREFIENLSEDGLQQFKILNESIISIIKDSGEPDPDEPSD